MRHLSRNLVSYLLAAFLSALALTTSRQRRHRRRHQPRGAAHGRHRGRYAPLQLARLHRAARLHHPARHLSAGNAGAALVLAQILQLADAALDLLLWRLRHPRQLRNFASRPAGLAWLRAARPRQRRDPIWPGAARRRGRNHDRHSLALPHPDVSPVSWFCASGVSGMRGHRARHLDLRSKLAALEQIIEPADSVPTITIALETNAVLAVRQAAAVVIGQQADQPVVAARL